MNITYQQQNEVEHSVLMLKLVSIIIESSQDYEKYTWDFKDFQI